MPSPCLSLVKDLSNSATAPITDKSNIAIGESCEREARIHEFDPDPTTSQILNDLAEVIEVPGETVHAVNQHGVALPDERQQSLQLWSLRVLP